MSLFAKFRTGIISIGAFALGVAFQRKLHLQADVATTTDVVDSPGGGQQRPLMQQDSPESIIAMIKEGGGLLGELDSPLITKHGIPSISSLRAYPNFLVSYDQRLRIPTWVLERLTAHSLSEREERSSRKGIDFFEDKSFHRYFRASNDDYKGSGYDRGHLAAAGNYRSSQEHTKATFVLSNIAPQVGRGFNRDKWNELEKYVRGRVRQFGEAWIITGPVFLPTREPANGKMYVKHEVIGKNNVAVPTHFFKVILYQKEPNSGLFQMECFLMPNADISASQPLKDFRIDPTVVERAAGILFFNAIPRNRIKVHHV